MSGVDAQLTSLRGQGAGDRGNELVDVLSY
jgi:hypothetical protein